jgi:hypothetical protein
MLSGTDHFASQYTSEEKEAFQMRLLGKVDTSNPVLVKSFLSMYAYPVDNSQKAKELYQKT